MRYDIIRILSKGLRILSKGLHINDYTVRAVNVRRGRFREELNALVVLEGTGYLMELFDLKVFKGRPPYYRPWVEIFNIRGSLSPGVVRGFHAGSVEDAILDLLSESLEPGERLYIEYYSDWETLKALELGVPPIATRLGYKLFVRGFTYLRDWYFPEGFMEGGPKLQAEKPLPEKEKKSLKEALLALKSFVRRYSNMRGYEVIVRAIDRAETLINTIEKRTGNTQV